MMIKTLSFAAVHFTVAFAVAYALTGSIVVGGAIAMVEPVVNTIAYHFHELAWKKAQSNAGEQILLTQAQAVDVNQYASASFAQ